MFPSYSGRRMRMPAIGLAALAAGALLAAQGLPEEHYTQWGPARSIDPGGVLGVNTGFSDGCPIESPDGHRLFVASDRPGGKGGIDIWVSYRQSPNHPWEEPVNLPAPINTPMNDFCPTPLTGDRLLFVSNRGSACGSGGDIYLTRLHPVNGWLEPEHLGCQVNSSGNEFAPNLLERGGQTVLFFSSDRGGNHDIYSSTRRQDGAWGPAVPQAELNTPLDDFRPNIRHDGLEIVFDSVRSGGPPDLWTSSRSSLTSPWSAPVRLGGNINSEAAESRASISRDGTRLYFGSSRAGGQGSTDVYMAERSIQPRSSTPNETAIAALPSQVADLSQSHGNLARELADVKATLTRIARRLGVVPVE